MACNGLKMGSFHLCAPQMVYDRFWKNSFLIFFDPFLVLKQPIFKAFWDFRRAKTHHHKLKTRQKHSFWHPIWCRIIIEKCHFFCTRCTLLTHFGLPLPASSCSGH